MISTERILLYINMRILKLSIGYAVLQQRHMPYIAVSAGLIHTTQFHLPRTVATVLNQGLGYRFNLKIRVFMHWSEIQGCLVLVFLPMTLIFSVNLFYCPFFAVSLPKPIQIRYESYAHFGNSRPYLSCFCRVLGMMTRHSGLHCLGPLGLIFILDSNYYCAKFDTNISTNMDTNIFLFLSIFAQNFYYFSPKNSYFEFWTYSA